MSFDNLMGYILSISVCMQHFITIFHSVQEISPFSLFFRIWISAKPQPMKNVISQSLGLDLVNINVYSTVCENIPLGLRDRAIFTFDQSQITFDNLSHWLHHVNINVYAKFHNNIPLSSSDRAIFTFSEFGARQSLDR